jgi:hypothetical protein
MAGEMVCIFVTVVFQNPASFDYVLVEMSLVAIAMAWGPYPWSTYALNMLSV